MIEDIYFARSFHLIEPINLSRGMTNHRKSGCKLQSKMSKHSNNSLIAIHHLVTQKKKSFQRCQNCQSTLTFSQFIIFHIIKNRHQNPSENQLPQIFVKQIAIFVQYFEKSGKSTLKKTKQISFDSFDSLKFFFYDVLMSLLE